MAEGDVFITVEQPDGSRKQIKQDDAEWSAVLAGMKVPELTDGKISASTLPDEIDARISVLGGSTAALDQEDIGEFELVVNTDKQAIEYGDGNGGRVSVLSESAPNPITLLALSDGTVRGYSLTVIPDNWWDDLIFNGGMPQVADITFGYGITQIGQTSCAGNLRSQSGASIYLPPTLQTIKFGAFWLGTYNEIYIPDSVVLMESAVFSDSDYKKIRLSKNCPVIPGLCFGGDILKTFEGDLTIPDGVVTISDSAFRNCGKPGGSLWISDTVETIGEWTFAVSNPLYYSTAEEPSETKGFDGTLRLGSGLLSFNGAAFNNQGFSRIECFATTAPTIAGSGTIDSVLTFRTTEIHVPEAATGYSTTYGGLTVVYDL